MLFIRNYKCKIFIFNFFLNKSMRSNSQLRAAARERGYAIAEGSLVISGSDGEVEWRFVAVSLGRSRAASLSELAEELAHFEGVASFSVSRARN